MVYISVVNNKYLIPGFLILLIGIVGGAGYLNYKTKQQSQTEEIQTQETTLPDEMQKGSIWEILKSDVSQKCGFLTNQEDSTIQGDVYVAGDRVAVMFVTDLKDGSNSESRMIKDGQTVYTWNETQKEGIKFEIDPTVDSSWMEGSNTEGLSNLSSDVQYTCEDWTEDDTVFQLPEDKTFVDLTVKF